MNVSFGKPHTVTLAVMSLLLGFGMPATATETSADLRVNGSIAPGGSCDMTVGNGAIEFGRVELNSDPTKPTPLEIQRVKMTLTCTTATRYALIAGTTAPGENPGSFGLVSGESGSLTGKMIVRLDNSSDHIEGVNAFHTSTAASADLATAQWGTSTSSAWPLSAGDQAIGFVLQDGSQAAPSYIKNFYTYLIVEPVVRPSGELDLRDEIAFQGNLGFEVRYF